MDVPPPAESLTCPQTSAPVCDTLLICRAELNRSMLRFTGKKRKKGQKLCENMPQFLCDCVCFAQQVEAQMRQDFKTVSVPSQP